MFWGGTVFVSIDAEKRKNAFVRFGKSEPGIKSKQNAFVRFGRPEAESRVFGQLETGIVQNNCDTFLELFESYFVVEKRKNAFVRFGKKDNEQCNKIYFSIRPTFITYLRLFLENQQLSVME